MAPGPEGQKIRTGHHFFFDNSTGEAVGKNETWPPIMIWVPRFRDVGDIVCKFFPNLFGEGVDFTGAVPVSMRLLQLCARSGST